MDTRALLLSFELASVTTLVLAVLAMPLAAWLAFSRRRWKVAVEALVGLPIVLPPTVIGFYLLVAMGPSSPLGAWVERATGQRLVFSFPGLLIASVVYSLPFAVQPFAAALAGVDRRLIEASWTLGVSRWGTFRRLVLPLAAPGVIAGMVLTFAHTLGEFGVVLMVGGNIAGRTRTASIAIFDEVQEFRFADAGRTALVLLAISFAALMATSLLRRRAVAA